MCCGRILEKNGYQKVETRNATDIDLIVESLEVEIHRSFSSFGTLAGLLTSTKKKKAAITNIASAKMANEINFTDDQTRGTPLRKPLVESRGVTWELRSRTRLDWVTMRSIR